MAADTQTLDIVLDAGPAARGGTERMCLVTRAVRPLGELIRFVVGPDGDVVPDLKAKLPGRGAWVTGSRETLDLAVRRKAFGRGFKREITVAADLVERTEALLERAALDALAMAGKAGDVATGFTKVEKALEHAHIQGLLHAREASPDGVRKIEALARRRFGSDADELPVVRGFSSAQMDLAFGRSSVIHAALLAGPASQTFLARTARLERFRAGGPGERNA